MTDQIMHCCDQIIRFAIMHRDNTIDSGERTLQFGYNFGRLIMLLNNINQTYGYRTILHVYTPSMAKTLITKFEFNTNIYGLLDYGFAIGYLQEWSNSDHKIWWSPIAVAAQKQDWKEIARITKNNLSKLDIPKESSIYLHLFKKDVKLNWHVITNNFIQANQQLAETILSLDYIN